MAIFLDTGYYIAFYNLKDKYHQKAMEIFQDLKSNNYGKIFTSLDVLDELFTFFQRNNNQHIANKIINSWFKEDQQFGTILFSTENTLSIATEIFTEQSQERKSLSFTDCLIIANCKELGISNLISFESGFHNLINVIQ
ncbi:MAG: type II toxin-antitoxin system VapC family toxin [Candidatus Kariarchaeaceae archaeon]|jgi:predicted nucleic acid-binding protein